MQPDLLKGNKTKETWGAFSSQAEKLLWSVLNTKLCKNWTKKKVSDPKN